MKVRVELSVAHERTVVEADTLEAALAEADAWLVRTGRATTPR